MQKRKQSCVHSYRKSGKYDVTALTRDPWYAAAAKYRHQGAVSIMASLSELVSLSIKKELQLWKLHLHIVKSRIA